MNVFLSGLVARLNSRLARLLGPVVFMVMMLVLLAAVSFDILSSLRAFVTGESLWSKAQKSGVAELRHYFIDGEEASYLRFQQRIALPLGDRLARLEMDRKEPDHAVARAGFLAGGNHAADIDGMIWLYRYFKHVPHVARAIEFWRQGDELIGQLIVAGDRFHGARRDGEVTPELRLDIERELERLDTDFDRIEVGFTFELGQASRLTLRILLVAISVVALGLLLMTGLFFRRLVKQSKQSQQAMALSEERLRLGFQGTNCGLWDWDIVSNEVFYSPWIYKLLEYGDQPIGVHNKVFVEMVHPNDRVATLAAGTAHIIHDVPYDIEYRIKTLTGKYLWVRSRAQAVRDPSGKAIRMSGSIFDISELKAAEHTAFIERELAQVTLAAIADAVIRTDSSGRINYCNAVAEKLFGDSFETIRDQKFDTLCPMFSEASPSQSIDLLEPVLSGRVAVYDNANLHYIDHHGRTLAIDASVASVLDPIGNFFGVVIILHDVSAEREHAAQLAYQASHDELTGLFNRREFERQLGALLERDAAAQGCHAILYLDLDQLKIVNDSGGHAAGDQLIRQLSALLRQCLRDGDMLARLGGDEFGVILKDCDADDAVLVAESLRKVIFETRFVWDGKSFSTGVSIGLVTGIETFGCLNDLMRVADAACFIAKDKGRNRVHRYHPQDHEQSLRHREIEWVSRINEALDRNLFCLHAQRIVPVTTALAVNQGHQHLELLLRLLDADGKLIAPMAFIPAAERYNLMPDIDRWVIRTAFDLLAAGFAKGVDAARVTCAINISGASIEDDGFLDYILEQQRRTSVPFTVICFEITETTAIANLPKASEFIVRLRSVGCLFSLDDFGSGMASFGYLKHLPVDFLKIDGSFVKDMVNDPIDCAMVEAINQIGQVMHKKTIAEFVEDDAIFACLKKIGVDYAQGYGIHKPQLFHANFLLDEQGDAPAASVLPALSGHD